MTQIKTERNERILSMRDNEHKTFREISLLEGIAESTVREIYFREKNRNRQEGE